MSFCIHVDSNEVGINKLEETDQFCPAATRTYKPIKHTEVRRAVIESVKSSGLTVANERWALSDPVKPRAGRPEKPGIYQGFGARMFGLLNIANGRTDRSWMIGVRSSYDQSLALGICAGLNVFVCDNLSFFGDFVTFRRHTSKIDVVSEAEKALGQIRTDGDRLNKWFDRLGETPVVSTDVESMVCDGIRAGLFPGASAKEYLNAWYDATAPAGAPGLAARLENGVYSDRTAYNAHELWTDLIGHRRNLTNPGNGLLNDHGRWNEIVGLRSGCRMN